MAVVEVDPDDLRRLVGRELSRDEIIDDLFSLGVEYEGETEDGEMEFEVVPDRPDRLSVEGLARSLRYDYGIDEGVYVPDLSRGDYSIEVDESVDDVRPYITGAVVRDVDLSGGTLESLIQLQEKLHTTLGRRRKKGAIGVHDLTMLKGKTVEYRGIEPDSDTFVPLAIGGGDDQELAEMSPRDVMDDHPVGSDYADILEGHDRVPAIYDSIGLFSFPPVINGKRTEVKQNSRDLFVEMTGIDQWTVDKMLNVLVYALDVHASTVEEVEVEYPDHTELKPDFMTERKWVEHDRIESILGVELEQEEVVKHLRRSGLDAEPENDGDETEYEVTVPPYRTDVMHPLDVVDDIGRSYGFNDLEPRYPDVSTVGSLTRSTRLENAVRKQLVGLGFQDLLNFVLTSPEANYDAVRLDEEEGDDPIRITNPYSEEYSMMRTWLIPSLVTVLSNNTHREYPQHLAEIGLCASRTDEEAEGGSGVTGVNEETHVAAVLCGSDAGYEDAKSRLSSLVADFDVSLETPATEHPSFIDGRVADVVIDGDDVGVIGEIHPEVLAKNEITLPVAGFEFEMTSLEG